MANPVVKWAGGKRQLLPEISARMPVSFGTYYEPFFGGGALYFDKAPKRAVVNDSNNQLINMYRQIKSNPNDVISFLSKYQNEYNEQTTKESRAGCYYKNREKFNQFISKSIFTPESAALFIFLNKAGFNGLYRVNAKGLLNVPSAHRKTLNSFDENNILKVSKLLQETEILQGDFEKACENAKKGDFVFFDSPYYGTFDAYQAGGFSKGDHERLAKLFKKLSDKGVYCILTNSETDFIKDLYKDFYIDVVSAKRRINCDGNKRMGTEVIICNFVA